MILTIIIFIITFHSPILYFKDLWVTTAMNTIEHQYLAKLFFTQQEIDEIMTRNKVLKPTESIRLNDISISAKTTDSKYCDASNALIDINRVSGVISDEFESDEISLSINGENPDSNTKETLPIQEFDISTPTYKGKILLIYDPSRVYVGISDKMDIAGERLVDMAKRYDAEAGINGGGFYDPQGNGSGGIPDGIVISKGKLIKGSPDHIYHIVGLTEDHKLIMGNYKLEDIVSMKVRDAVFFTPILILNGETVPMQGNGGWGIDPRTAIGQRKDGTIIFLVIDGRQPGYSIGASIKDVRDIMVEYGAYNAFNLDGGTSTSMYKDGKLINRTYSKYGGRKIPTAFLVRKK